MENRHYKNTDIKVSLLGLGCMRLPKMDPNKAEIDFKAAEEIVDYAYANGINYYDTAYVYHEGLSEGFIGQALKKYPRESYMLATKMPIWEANTKEDVEKLFKKQLERCQVDYFDYYLLHAVKDDNFQKYIDLSYEYLLDMKKQGKIKHLGFSFHDTPEVLEKICDKYTFDFVQIQLNYLDWEMQNSKKQYEILDSHGIQCIIMEPVRGGTLANPCETSNEIFKVARPDKSVASWAIRYAASLPNVLTVLSGMSNMEQIIDNVGTMTNFEPLTNEEYKVVEEALEAYKTKDTVPCTACRYCMDCSFGVDIPKMFELYNDYAVKQELDVYKNAYNETAESIRADHCVACGACVEKCPQNINIPEKMEMIKELV